MLEEEDGWKKKRETRDRGRRLEEEEDLREKEKAGGKSRKLERKVEG